MNENIYSEQWKQMRTQVKSWWEKLDDFDLDRIGGRKDQLITLLEEKYGFAHDYAMREVERRFKEFSDKSGGAVANMAAKAQEFGTTAVSKAGDAAAAVGEKFGSLAGALRQNAPREGSVGTAAASVADGLESAGSYLSEKKFGHLGKDLTTLVRTYPIQAVMIGIGVGFLLARRTK